MRDEIDCAVLMIAPHERWMQDWVAAARPLISFIRLHPYRLDCLPEGREVDVQALSRCAPALRRFDVSLLPIAQSTLAWTRTALACAGATLTTPVVGVTDALQSVALHDLLQGGLSDFVRIPVCTEELRVRLARSVHQDVHSRSCATRVAVSRYSPRPPGAKGSSALALEQAWAAYGDTGMPRLSQREIARTVDVLNAAPSIHVGESFRQAKLRVVSSFEQEYVSRALKRHGGNVARAARASVKHRRAFWAVMQKHGIDAARYRRGGHSRMGDSEN